MSKDEFEFVNPEDKDKAAARSKIVNTAFEFLDHFYNRNDLTACWGLLDPTLRLCWVQWWMEANSAALESEGYDLNETAEDVTEKGNQHELWDDFQRVLLRDFHSAFPLEVDQVGIGSAQRVIVPGVELLYVHATVPEGGYWKPGEESLAAPIVLRIVDSEWKVLNFGFEAIPEPGWPPQLG